MTETTETIERQAWMSTLAKAPAAEEAPAPVEPKPEFTVPEKGSVIITEAVTPKGEQKAEETETPAEESAK